MKYDVLAQAFDRSNGFPAGPARVERIDPTDNRLFKSAKSIMDVKEAYEDFWNELNPTSPHVVFVQQVTPAA